MAPQIGTLDGGRFSFTPWQMSRREDGAPVFELPFTNDRSMRNALTG